MQGERESCPAYASPWNPSYPMYGYSDALQDAGVGSIRLGRKNFLLSARQTKPGVPQAMACILARSLTQLPCPPLWMVHSVAASVSLTLWPLCIPSKLGLKSNPTPTPT